jgi:chitinase
MMMHKNKLKIIFGFSLFFLLVISMLYFLSSSPKIIMSYVVPEDTLLSPNNIQSIQQFRDKINNLNVVAYAFLHVNPDGTISVNDNDFRVGIFDFFSLSHSDHHDLKKIISFGGADDKTSFFYAIRKAENFVSSTQELLARYKLSGVDLDFEIGRPYTSEEANLFADLIVNLRKKLGNNILISVPTIIDQETLLSMGGDNWKKIAKNADFISMMCFDLISPFNGRAYTGIASNLYLVPNASKQWTNAHVSCDQSIHYLITLGVPAAKILLGIPAYAISYGGVDANNNGLFQSSVPAQTPMLDDMGAGLLRYSTVLDLNKAGFKDHILISNGYVNGVWSYNRENHQFITFDNPKSVQDKMDYVLKNNLAGVMMWRIGQDVPIDNKGSLLKTIVEGLHQ